MRSDHCEGIEATYFRDDQGVVKFILKDDHSLVEFFTPESSRRPSAPAVWKQWRDQAIAALPEHLRNDSDYRRAIDWLYQSSGEMTPDELAVDIINRPPIGGYDIGGVGFTDIDERAEGAFNLVTLEEARADARHEIDRLRAQRDFWADWKARAIAALPEAERNDPNRLKEIDTTLELASRGTGGPPEQVMQWMQIAPNDTLYLGRQNFRGAK